MPVESNTVSENGWGFGPIVLIEEQVLWVPEPRLLRNTSTAQKLNTLPASRSNVPKKILVVFSSGEAGALATGMILSARSWATRWATPTTYFLVVKHTRYSRP